MSRLSYMLDIKFHVNEDQFEVGGNVSEEGRTEIVENFLRSQIGAGKDNSKPNEKDIYQIQLIWYPRDDTTEVSSDTGNKSLRDGILLHYFESLGK